jgi:hypothetical protein
MYDNQLDYRAIQRQADAAVKRQQARTRRGLFIVNFLLYILFMAITWGLLLTREYNYSGFTIATMSVLSAGWTVGVILHGATLWLSSERGSRRMRERFLTREIAREMARLNLDNPEMPIWDEKVKRRERLIDEDGELVDFVDRNGAFREETK